MLNSSLFVMYTSGTIINARIYKCYPSTMYSIITRKNQINYLLHTRNCHYQDYHG